MAASVSRVCSWVTVLLSSILQMVICCPLLAALEEFWGCVVQLELLEVSSRERFLIWQIYVNPGGVIGKQGMQMEEHLSVLDLSSDLNNRESSGWRQNHAE